MKELNNPILSLHFSIFYKLQVGIFRLGLLLLDKTKISKNLRFNEII